MAALSEMADELLRQLHQLQRADLSAGGVWLGEAELGEQLLAEVGRGREMLGEPPLRRCAAAYWVQAGAVGVGWLRWGWLGVRRAGWLG